MINNKSIGLIQEIVKSLQPKDPIQEAIDSLDDNDMTSIDDDQLATLVDYMKEMIDHSTSRGSKMAPAEAANMALEDVAGFEGAAPKVMRDTVGRLVQAYVKKFGS